jgi:alkyl hydroperoxide reductase subunit AhpF
MVVDTFGGQVLETLGIENVIGTPYVEGPQLMRQVEEPAGPPPMTKTSKVSLSVNSSALKGPLTFSIICSIVIRPLSSPDVVQALNIMSVLNPKISHTMIEGGMYQAEVDADIGFKC